MSWLDDIKVVVASSAGIGNWWMEIDIILKLSISIATLFYIILKIRHLLKQDS
jgi:hypothetical protein